MRHLGLKCNFHVPILLCTNFTRHLVAKDNFHILMARHPALVIILSWVLIRSDTVETKIPYITYERIFKQNYLTFVQLWFELAALLLSRPRCLPQTEQCCCGSRFKSCCLAPLHTLHYLTILVVNGLYDWMWVILFTMGYVSYWNISFATEVTQMDWNNPWVFTVSYNCLTRGCKED